MLSIGTKVGWPWTAKVKFSRNCAQLRIFRWTDVCCWWCDCEACKWGVMQWVVSYIPRLSHAYLC